ncbi:Hypothetical predicted protein [Mytilus galloprovincialis]|uniref:B box-type domain-containing protein n=1 Tax=Mytilus galloprovincialis TaxID=29158 RepID=A0A8B6G6B6_MYTGA|nr:Hypothetical predicted protein [Mytilus galloprovincialis]
MADTEVCAGCCRENEAVIVVSGCNDCDEPVCRPCSKVYRRFVIPHDIVDIKHNPNIGQANEQQHERLIQLRSTIDDRLNRLEKNGDAHYNQGFEKISSNTEQLMSLAQTTQANLQDIEKAEVEESEVNIFHLVKHLDTSQLSNEKNLQFLEDDISNMSLQFIHKNFIDKVDAMFDEFGNDGKDAFLRQQSRNKAGSHRHECINCI